MRLLGILSRGKGQLAGPIPFVFVDLSFLLCSVAAHLYPNQSQPEISN